MMKISVIMPAYNAEKYINEAIDSILNQTYTDFEFIIVNDGSTDKTSDIVKSYSDKRIVFVENEKNMGIVYSLNKGLKLAKGEYIARMDADDISLKNRLEKQMDFMDNNLDVAVLGTSIQLFNNDNELSVMNFSSNSDFIKADMLFNSCVAHPTVMIRKKILENYSLQYDANYHGREDFKLWWEISKNSNIYCLQDVLLKYRLHNDQITNNYHSVDLLKHKLFLKERIEDIDVVLSDEEIDLMFKYCINDFKSLDYCNVYNLLYIYNKIIKRNKENNYFNMNALKRTCSLSVNYMLSNVIMTKKEKIKLFFEANRLGIYSIIMFVKSSRILLKK